MRFDLVTSDDGITVEELRPFGWLAGGYRYRSCPDCGEEFTAAKRSRRCRPCAVRALKVERAKPVPVIRTEFWWITSVAWGLPEPTPARVIFKDEIASGVRAFGEDECFGPDDCTLIARIRTPDQVEDLVDAMWTLIEDMGVSGNCVSTGAKAKARVAFEPFNLDADGEEAPLSYLLADAERVMAEIYDWNGRLAGRKP